MAFFFIFDISNINNNLNLIIKNNFYFIFILFFL